jgi:hypothetical protein
MPRPKYDEINSFLMGGESVPSASFLKLHTVHEGEILDLAMRQQTDPDTREPEHWPNGDPKMVLVVTVQTDENDPEIEDDDGRRRFWLRFKMKDAVAEAVKKSAPDEGLEIGGWLGIEFVKQDKAQSRVKSGVKHFEAWYEKPDPAKAANEFLSGDDPEDDPEPEPEPEPPKRSRAKTAEKAAEKPARGRGRGSAAPDPEEDAPAPTRGRGRASATAAKPARGRGRASSAKSEYTNDDDGEEPF